MITAQEAYKKSCDINETDIRYFYKAIVKACEEGKFETHIAISAENSKYFYKDVVYKIQKYLKALGYSVDYDYQSYSYVAMIISWRL